MPTIAGERQSFAVSRGTKTLGVREAFANRVIRSSSPQQFTKLQNAQGYECATRGCRVRGSPGFSRDTV